MRIGDFPIVEALVAHRNHLIGLRDEGKVSIEINGRMMPVDFSQAMVPAVRELLTRQIGSTEAELGALGVRFD